MQECPNCSTSIGYHYPTLSFLPAEPDGTTVDEGEDLYTVGTDKVSTDIPSPSAGVLRHGPVVQDENYPVGTTLGVLETG